MKNLVLRVGGCAAVALLFVAAALGGGQSDKWHGDGPERGEPCADGIVSVERTEGCPVEVEILKTFCRPSTNTVWVQYALRNVGTQPVLAYEVWTSERYERFVSNNQGFGAEKLALEPGEQIERWASCGGKVSADVVDPGELTGIALYVTEVDLVDGTTWRPTAAVPGAPE